MKIKIAILYSLLHISLLMAQEHKIELKKGMIVSFIASSFHNSEAQQNASTYFDKVFPLAQKYSFRPLIRFNNLQKGNNHFTADALGIYSWDNQKQFDAFHQEESWPALKATRPQYWKNLRSVHITLHTDKTITFVQSKVYRITYIWLYDFENASENLAKYTTPMRGVIERLGGRFVVGFDKSAIKSISSLNNDRKPDRIGITEWPNAETHQHYINSPEFKEYSKFFFSSVAEFEAFNTRISN